MRSTCLCWASWAPRILSSASSLLLSVSALSSSRRAMSSSILRHSPSVRRRSCSTACSTACTKQQKHCFYSMPNLFLRWRAGPQYFGDNSVLNQCVGSGSGRIQFIPWSRFETWIRICSDPDFFKDPDSGKKCASIILTLYSQSRSTLQLKVADILSAVATYYNWIYISIFSIMYKGRLVWHTSWASITFVV